MSARERVVGFSLLAALAAIVLTFAWSGGRPGPTALAAPVDTPAPAEEGPFALTSPTGWPRGAIERYDADTVFEKINGKADAYHALGFVELSFASYSNPGNPDLYVDAYLYDMAEPLHAYGIYRAQRASGARPFEAGDEANASGAAAFARRGRFYLEVIASDAAAGEEAQALAAAIANSLPAEGAPVRDPEWLPREGLERVAYVRENCMMVEALTDAFLAAYENGAQVVVARPASPDAACEEARETFEFLKTPAEFRVVGEYVVGVVRGDTALLEKVARGLEEPK